MAGVLRHKRHLNKQNKPTIVPSRVYTVEKLNGKGKSVLVDGTRSRKEAEKIFIKTLNKPGNIYPVILARDIKQGIPVSPKLQK